MTDAMEQASQAFGKANPWLVLALLAAQSVGGFYIVRSSGEQVAQTTAMSMDSAKMLSDARNRYDDLQNRYNDLSEHCTERQLDELRGKQ